MRPFLLAAAAVFGCSLVGCQPRVEVISKGSVGPAGSRYAATITETPGLIAYFRMTDAAAETLLDRVQGMELRGETEAVAAPGAIPDDPEPRGVELADRTSGGFAGVAAPSLLALKALSVELWLAPRLMLSGASCALPDRNTWLAWVDGVQSPDHAAWSLGLSGDDMSVVQFSTVFDPDGTGQELDGLMATTVPGVINLPGPPSCAVDHWQHVVATAESVGPKAGLRVYVDGELTPPNAAEHPNVNVPDSTSTGGLGSFSVDAALHLADVITDNGDVEPDPTSPYLGGLDEFALYSRALTPTEVAEHYAAGLEGGRTSD